MHEFKYRRTGVHIFTGVLFISTGLLICIFFLNIMIGDANLEILALMLPFVLWIYAGYYNISINRRNYITYESNFIAIDRSPLLPKVRFYTSDIEVVTKNDENIWIGLKSGKEIQIRFNSVSVFDRHELKNIFNDYDSIIR